MDLVDCPNIDYFIAEKVLDKVNGDTAFVHGDPESLFLGIIDGAGHGPEAHAIAKRARIFLESNVNSTLHTLMADLHNELRGTRGGVAIIGTLDVDNLLLRYVGVGNIVLKIFGAEPKRALTQQGILGYNIITPVEKNLQLTRGDVLVMQSDGISSHIDISDYPQILRDDAKTIAKTLVRQFAKSDDDATCLVLRVL